MRLRPNCGYLEETSWVDSRNLRQYKVKGERTIGWHKPHVLPCSSFCQWQSVTNIGIEWILGSISWHTDHRIDALTLWLNRLKYECKPRSFKAKDRHKNGVLIFDTCERRETW